MFQTGFIKDNLALSKELELAVKSADWCHVDQICGQLVLPGGALFERLLPLAKQSRMEYIINVRDAQNDWEEDGIWHDDGSRVLAFTLGLNLDVTSIAGGELLMREKGSPDYSSLPPPAWGELIIFKTGVDGYEHKVTAVTQGLRAVMAGWCYE